MSDKGGIKTPSKRLTLADLLTQVSADNSERFEHVIMTLYQDLVRQIVARAETGANRALVKPDMELLNMDARFFRVEDISEILAALLRKDGVKAQVRKDSNRLISVSWPTQLDFYTRDN